MNSQRPPWWMYIVAASFLFLHLMEVYLVVWGPAFPQGLDATFASGTLRLDSIEAETVFSRAGLRAGDQILAVSGLRIQSPRDWTAAMANVQAEQPETWTVLRGQNRIDLAIPFEKATFKNRIDDGVAEYLTGSLVFFVIGLFIGLRRPRDPAARIGAWLFLTASAAFGLMIGWAVLWRQIPMPAQVVLWIPEISRFAIDGIFLTFFAIFPRRLFRQRWPWFVIWIPVLATLPWRVYGFYAVIYRPAQAAVIPNWINQAMLLRTMVYVPAGFVFLLINYGWFADLNERRRIRVLVAGTAIGLAAAATTAWMYSSQAYGADYVGILWRMAPLFILACPFAFAYAILRHRVMDIHVIIRQGLQYALARGAVLGIVPVLAAALIVDLAVNSREPLASILQARGWAYAGIGGLAIVASFRRKQWLEALDRRFFRERYDSQRVLRAIAEEIRGARSLEDVAARVVAQIETAFHPEFVSIMIRRRTEPEYGCLASFPAGHTCPPIAADSKLVSFLRVLGKPLEVLLGDSSWLEARLPAEELEFVRRVRIDLVVPVITAAGATDALLAVGIKRSEEPYTREDQALLEIIALSLARLLEQPPTETSPRLLAGRYLLERRLGQGGMGSVYAAIDKVLDRRVAVKVIREDLVRSAEIAQRFHREARAAAAFAHPNVVTVHDYGIENEIRPFLVMELLDGDTLRDELNRRKRLDSSRILNIFRGVCSAVEAAHRRQLIHRDLKPENIFLARADEGGEIVKLLDFGIAKFLPVSDGDAPTLNTVETNTGVVLGTLAYISPEQLIGENPAASWDLWALAVMTYETLTGKMPFPMQSASDWRVALMAGRFTPLTNHTPVSPDPWQTFFDRSFATDRAKRPKSASEFFSLLEEAVGRNSAVH